MPVRVSVRLFPMPHHQNRGEFIAGQLANFFEQAALAETDIHLPHKRFRCISRADILHAWIQCNWRASAGFTQITRIIGNQPRHLV